MSEQSPMWLVQVEFERVQSYLFAVPELRAMIGANTLIGEVLRGTLTDKGFSDTDDLPAVAQRNRACLPAGVAFRASLEEDQTLEASRDQDRPDLAWQHGVLSRDGGHLRVVFRNRASAEEFIAAARQLVSRRLPGLPVKASLSELTPDKDGRWKEGQTVDLDGGRAGLSLADLPPLQVCQRTGQGPASEQDEREGGRWISDSVAARRKAGEKFDRGKSNDVLGLMRKPLLDRLGLKDAQDTFPNEFEDIAGSRYLAVIHADGNRIGSRSKASRKQAPEALSQSEEQTPEDFFQSEASGECFFRSMRVAVRSALLAALKTTFQGRPAPVPFRLMMLGGDDLLLVCDAPFALPFVLNYAAELDKRNLEDRAPLHVGAGVAIVQRKFPFHRSHDLAEQLAASAKRFDRGTSAVDWLVLSDAWQADVADTREGDAVHVYQVGGQVETTVLSHKPYRILGEGLTLEGLLKAAKAPELPARSQLAALAASVPLGRRQADAEFQLLRPAQRAAFNAVGMHRSFWTEVGSGVHATALLDFLEVVELSRMEPSNERDRPDIPV